MLEHSSGRASVQTKAYLHVQCYVSQDFDLCVTVFVAQPDESQPWQFLAKHRAHYKQIEGESARSDTALQAGTET